MLSKFVCSGHDVSGMRITVTNDSYVDGASLDGNCHSGLDTSIGRTHMFACQNDVVGQYVVISMNDEEDRLYLTEVQVFGGVYRLCIII